MSENALGREPEDVAADSASEATPEVRAEEFTAGAAMPIGGSPLPSEVVDELRAPLDPNRIRTRAGRGRGQFEYLAGHDVKRRANELFGFGNWGSELVQLREIAAVQVTTDDGKEGWHVAYSAIVRVQVNGCLPISDVGYGDGVEYGAAAFATARELAVKEASTDALKRALTQFGDQFGLILYAKADEKKRIQSDSNAESSRKPGTRAASRGAAVTTPRSWAEIGEWAGAYGEELGWQEWVRQASFLLFGTVEFKALDRDQRNILGQKASGAVIALREAHDPSTFPPPTRGEVQKAWASVLNGQVLPGPDWRLDPGEAFPTFEEYQQAEEESKTAVAEGKAEHENAQPAEDEIKF